MSPKERLQEIKDGVFDWSVDINLFGEEYKLNNKQIKWLVKNLDKIIEALEEVLEEFKIQ